MPTEKKTHTNATIEDEWRVRKALGRIMDRIHKEPDLKLGYYEQSISPEKQMAKDKLLITLHNISWDPNQNISLLDNLKTIIEELRNLATVSEKVHKTTRFSSKHSITAEATNTILQEIQASIKANTEKLGFDLKEMGLGDSLTVNLQEIKKPKKAADEKTSTAPNTDEKRTNTTATNEEVSPRNETPRPGKP